MDNSNLRKRAEANLLDRSPLTPILSDEDVVNEMENIEKQDLSDQERLKKMQDNFQLLKQSDNSLQEQAVKNIQKRSTFNPSQEQITNEMEQIERLNKEHQKQSEAEFEKSLDLKYRQKALGIPEISPEPLDSLREVLPSLDEIAPFQSQQIEAPYAVKKEQSREPAGIEDQLPKIETAPSTKQAALQSIEKEEVESIKPAKRDLVEEALQRVRENKRMAAIHRATSNLGAAIASTGALTKVSPDEQSLKNIEEETEMPVQEMKFKQEQEKVQRDLANAEKMADPNSDISLMTRNMLGQVGLSHLAKGNISAQDLKNAGIDVDSLLTKKIQMDQAAAIREQTKATRQDARMADMAARLAPKIQNKQFDEMASLNTQVGILKHAAANPNPQNDAAIVYSFVKALDPGSAVKEGEIAFTEAGRSIPTKIRQYLYKGATGQGLTPEERKNIIAFAENAAKVKTQIWKQSAQPYLNQAEKLGIPTDMVAPGLESLQKTEDTVSKTQQGKVLLKRKSDGAVASVDATEADKILRTKPDKYERVN